MEKFAEITGGSALLLPLREGLFDAGKKYEPKNGKRCIAVVLAGVLLVTHGMQLEREGNIPKEFVHTQEKSVEICVENVGSKVIKEEIPVEISKIEMTPEYSMPSYEVVQEEEMAVPEVIPNVIFPEIEEPVVVPPIVEKPLVEEEQGEVIVEEVDPPSAFSGFVIDENGMICGIDTEILSISDGYLELPSEDCVGIRRGALAEIGDLIREVYIPSNISTIEEGAFSGLTCLEWIEAEPGNTGCISVDGVLFNGNGTTLLTFPSGRTDGYIVPVNVTGIASSAFANTQITFLDLWSCEPLMIGKSIFGEQGGKGLEVRVQEKDMEWYQNAFAGYDVCIL